jgi:hypothetical protein
MARMLEGVGSGPLLNHVSRTEDDHPIGDRAHQSEIVGDEEQRKSLIALKPLQQIDDRGLHRDIECRCDLIADEDFRLADEGAGDTDPLPFASG